MENTITNKILKRFERELKTMNLAVYDYSERFIIAGSNCSGNTELHGHQIGRKTETGFKPINKKEMEHLYEVLHCSPWKCAEEICAEEICAEYVVYRDSDETTFKGRC